MTEPATDPVLYAVDSGVATITFNRPDAMNALDVATKESLREAVAHAADDSAARCVVLAGTGRAFCVGQDLREHTSLLADDVERLWRTVPDHYNPVAYALATMAKPVIAAVNGVAAGAGASFAFACDFRILAESASYNLAFAGIGLSCDSGSSWTLPRLIGVARAKELLMRPRTVPSAEALRLGLATSVVPDGEALDAALDLARELAAGPTLAYGAIRRSIAHSASHNLADALAYEAEMMRMTGSTEDHRDAVDSFVAKQRPVFHAR